MDVDKRPTKSLSVLIMGAFSVLFLALLGIVAATILTQKGEIEKRHTALTESLARIAVTNLEHRLKDRRDSDAAAKCAECSKKAF